MSVLTSSLLSRIDDVTNDPQRKRFALERIALWLNEAAGLIAEMHPRASTARQTVTLVAGAEQDLRNGSTTEWVRLFEVMYPIVAGAPGAAMRQVDSKTLDRTFPNWRRRTPTALPQEYALDERAPYSFDVNPPALAGVQVRVLAAVRPAPCCVLNTAKTALADPAEVFPLAAGYDVPAIDWVLYRLFSKDAGDATYAARAKAHLAAAQLVIGPVTKDAA